MEGGGPETDTAASHHYPLLWGRGLLLTGCSLQGLQHRKDPEGLMVEKEEGFGDQMVQNSLH